jgi:putative membrane protein
MPARELLLFGVIENRGLVVVAAIWGFLWQLSWQLGYMRGRDLLVSDAIIGPIATAFDRAGIVAGVLLTLLLVVVFLVSLRVVSILWALVKLHGFTLRHHDGSLSTTCGLFTRVSTAIPARRIQVLTVREGPLHRLFRRVELRADIVGGAPEESSATHERLAPLVRSDEAMPLVRRIEPALDLQQVAWRPVHPRARRRLLVRHAVVAALASAVLAVNLGWPLLFLLPLLLPLLWLLAARQARALAYCLNGEGVFFRSGWLWRRTSGARLDKVQTITLVESPFDRRHGMASLHVDNAGLSHASHRLRIPYLEAATARLLLDELEARAARSAFRL